MNQLLTLYFHVDDDDADEAAHSHAALVTVTVQVNKSSENGRKANKIKLNSTWNHNVFVCVGVWAMNGSLFTGTVARCHTDIM